MTCMVRCVKVEWGVATVSARIAVGCGVRDSVEYVCEGRVGWMRVAIFRVW